MSRSEKPKKNLIKYTLIAEQQIWLAKGYSTKRVHVSVQNYTQDPKFPYFYPKRGNFESFKEIKEKLKKEFEEQFPKVAFPKAEPFDEIVLYGRNETDPEYVWELGTFSTELDEIP